MEPGSTSYTIRESSQDPMRGIHRLSGAVFINLLHRKDRYEQITQELAKVGLLENSYKALAAHYVPFNGHLGCAKSHLEALQTIEKLGWETGIVLEDDFEWVASPKEVHATLDLFLDHFHPLWDVFFFSTKRVLESPTDHPLFQRVTTSLDANAYVVHRHYLPKLSFCFQTAIQLMEQDDNFVQSSNKAIDVVWRILQEQDLWYISSPSLGRQRISFSDTQHKVRDRYALDRIPLFLR